MNELAGQITTELAARGDEGETLTVISAGREVEQGARSMLIFAAGLFRLDVVPQDDMVQTIVRNLSPQPGIRLRLEDVAGSTSIPTGSQHTSTISVGRFGGEITLVSESGEELPTARLLVGSISHVDRGLTSLTAQATLLRRRD